MPYEPTDYDTAVSAFNVLPESMAVESLISLRQRNEQGGLSIDKMKRDQAQEEEQVRGFSAFNEEYQHMGITPGDYEGNASKLSGLQGKYVGNAKVQGVMKDLREASEAPLKARKMRYESKSMDELDATADDRLEASRLGIKNALAKGKLDEGNLKILQEDQDSNAIDNFYKLAGGINDNFPEVAIEAAKWGNHYGSNPEMTGQLRKVGGMIAGLGKASQLEQANKHVVAAIEPTIQKIGERLGFTLDYNLPPEEVAEAYANARKLEPDGSPQDAEIEKAIDAHSSLYNSMQTRKTLAGNIQKLLSNRVDLKDPTAADAFKTEMAGLTMQMGPLVGRVEKDWSDRSAKEANDDRIRGIAKDNIERQNKSSQIEDREGDSQLDRQKFQQQKEEKAKSAINQIMIDFFKDPKNLTGSAETISKKAGVVRAAAEETLKTSSAGFDKTRK